MNGFLQEDLVGPGLKLLVASCTFITLPNYTETTGMWIDLTTWLLDMVFHMRMLSEVRQFFSKYLKN